jgi:ribosome recycling factor
MVYSDGKRIQITPYDPALLGTINTALQKSGFSSYVFSKNSVVVSVPKRCGEEKEKIIKFVRALGEQAKISIRNIRHKARKELDDKEVQKMTDAANKEIVDLVEMKVDEING